MYQGIIKNISLNLDINAEKRVEGNIDVKLYSKDIGTGVFEFSFIDEKNSKIELDETYSAKAMIKLNQSENIYVTDMEIDGDIARFVFPHGFITKDGTVTLYVYLTKNDKTSDVASISFKVFKSEIDDVATDIVTIYDKNYESILNDFEEYINLSKEEWKVLIEKTENFVEEIEKITLDQFIEMKMDEKYNNIEQNYITRLLKTEQDVFSLNEQLAETDNEIIQARGGKATLTERLDDADGRVALAYSKIDETTASIRSDLISNSENLAVYKANGYVDIVNRSSAIYSVIDASNITTITSSGYVSGSDFAVLLSENIPAEKSVRIRIKGSLEASRTIILRFGGATQVSYISPFDTVAEVVLSNSGSNLPSAYVYFDFVGNAKLKIEDIEIVYQDTSELKSIYEVEQRAKPYEYVNLNSGAIEKLIKTATTYLQNLNSLTYGNSNTLYDPTVSLVGGKFQIDCSSFFSAVYQGVAYTESRYVKSDNSTSRWGFTTYDGRRYRYANQLAKFANEKGYGFKPKPDLSDLRPGDVLFFSWSGSGGDVEFKSRAWMGIQHVAIFLDKEDTGRYSTLQLDNGFTNVLYMADENYMSKCVYAARFPLANLDSEFNRENLITVGHGEYLNNAGLSCTLSEPLKRYSFYTLVVEYELLTPERRLIIQNSGWKNIAAHTVNTGTGRRRSVYRILYNHGDSESLKVSISGSGDGRANFYGQQLYKGFPIFD